MAESTKKTTSTSSAKKDANIAKFEKKISELEGLLKNALDTINMLTAAKEEPVSNPQNMVITVPSTDVVLVYMSDSMGHLETTSVSLDFNRWGQEFTLTRQAFDEIVGKYWHWFEDGRLAVSGAKDEYIKVAAAKGLKTDKEYYLDAKKLNSIGKMSVDELEALWNSVTQKNHRESIVTFVKRKFIEEDPLYRDRAKIDLLNRLTSGGFKREQDELSGNYKYQPINIAKIA